MKSSVKLSLFGMAFVILFTTYVCTARADLPPEVWHCASQEQCIAMLLGNDVVLSRKGVVKGTLAGMGSGIGKGVVSNGWLIVTRNSTTEIFFYHIETGDTCTLDLLDQCYAGGTLNGIGYAACPNTETVRKVDLSTCQAISLSANGREGMHMAMGPDRAYIIFGNEDYLGHIPDGDSLVYIVSHNIATGGHMVSYSSHPTNTDILFFNSGDTIFSKPAEPISSGWPDTFFTIPTGGDEGYLDSSSTHVLVTSTGGDAWLIEIETQSATQLSAPGAESVALSSDTAFVRTVNGVLAFDMNGVQRPYLPSSEFPDWIAYAKPTLPPVCENGLVEPGETCDSTDFDGLTCANYPNSNFDGGELYCSVSCDTVFTSSCYSCGDGTVNPGEFCDGTDMGTASCSAAGYANGEASCTASCTADYSQCYTCGNGLIEGAESCEGADLNGATCSSEGFVDGTISCGGDCMLDTSACHMCGNAVTEADETCDGTDTPGNICQTLDLGYTGGELVCTSACNGLDDSGCYTCGDGNVDTTEECDGVNLNSQDCGTLGLGTGTLSCFENCAFNYSQCSGVPTEYCGNNVVDPGEECDDGNRDNSDDCSETCKIIAPTCGLGEVDAGESCDGTDLNGETCETLGYQAGVLYCGGDCQFRTDDCHFISTPQTISLQLDAEPESGELAEDLQIQYEDLKATLTPRCISQEVNGDLVLTTVQGSYCAVRATVLTKSVDEKMFSFIYMPENALEDEAPVLRFYQTGTIAQNFGGNITAFQGLQVKTVLVQDKLYHVTQERISSMGMKFLAIHPETQSRGRWLAINIGTGSTSMCTDQEAANCATLVPEQGQLILNLNALEDISGLDWTPPKSGGGCNCTTGSNSSNSFPLFLLLGMAFLFWNRRNRQKN